jgi:hypothetical protein
MTPTPVALSRARLRLKLDVVCCCAYLCFVFVGVEAGPLGQCCRRPGLHGHRPWDGAWCESLVSNIPSHRRWLSVLLSLQRGVALTCLREVDKLTGRCLEGALMCACSLVRCGCTTTCRHPP